MSREESPGSRPTAEAYVYLALMTLIGSTTATAAKLAVRELPVGLVPIIRYGGAVLFLLPLLWGHGRLFRLVRADCGRLLAAAALCVPVNQTMFLYASRLAPTTHVGLFYASCPLVVLGLAVALGQERLVASRAVGILASVLGALVVGLGNFWNWGQEGADALRGDMLLVGAVVSWGAFITVSKPLVARHGAMVALLATFLAGTLLDLPIAAVTFGAWPPMLARASAVAWWSMAYLTVVVSVIGLGCQNLALHKLDASQVAAIGNASPLLTVIWGVWLLHEPFQPTLAIGGALIFAGILVSSRGVNGNGNASFPEAGAVEPAASAAGVGERFDA